MIEFLLSATLSCQDGRAIIARIEKQDNMSELIKNDVINEIKLVMNCDYDYQEMDERSKGKTLPL